MRIALIGNGKTGKEVAKLATSRHQVTVFNRQNPVTLEGLREHDVVIVFVPASGMCDLAEILLASRLPVVSGTTGFDYSALPSPEAPWIVASNFSLGMNMTFLLTKSLSALTRLTPTSFGVHEVHHVSKLDAPSGTALSLQTLLPRGARVTSERVGEARGTHTVEAQLPGETIRLTHEAQDRRVFAEGALLAAETMVQALPIGIHHFEDQFAARLFQEVSRD